MALHHLQQRRAPVGLCRVTLQKILKLPSQEASNRLLTEGILQLGLGPTFARIVQFNLTLSLPECLMEFCTVTLTFESAHEILWCDHSNETSLPLLTHGANYFSNLTKGNLVEICSWLNSALKGLKKAIALSCLMIILLN